MKYYDEMFIAYHSLYSFNVYRAFCFHCFVYFENVAFDNWIQSKMEWKGSVDTYLKRHMTVENTASYNTWNSLHIFFLPFDKLRLASYMWVLREEHTVITTTTKTPILKKRLYKNKILTYQNEVKNPLRNGSWISTLCPTMVWSALLSFTPQKVCAL